MTEFEREMAKLHEAVAGLGAALLREPVVRLMLRHGWLICGFGFLLVSLLCVCMGLYSPWQIYDETFFALLGLVCVYMGWPR